MAVFFKNDCKFNGCGKIFSSLSSLIEHIEATHIDFNPRLIEEFEEQRPIRIPLSYILKYSQSHSRQTREIVSNVDVKLRLFQHASKSYGERYNGAHRVEDEDTGSDESSNDSWIPPHEVSSTVERKNGSSNQCVKEKPFACSVPGCKKRYKNINGIKYHYKNGHKMFERPKKVIKHLPSKKIKEKNLKVAFKKMMSQETNNNNYTLQLPSTSRANMHSWTETNINNNSIEEHQGNVKVTEDIENFIPSLIPNGINNVNNNNNNNYEFDSINCNSTDVANACSQWPVAYPTGRNEVTIIRSCRQNEDITTNNIAFVAYDYGAS